MTNYFRFVQKFSNQISDCWDKRSRKLIKNSKSVIKKKSKKQDWITTKHSNEDKKETKKTKLSNEDKKKKKRKLKNLLEHMMAPWTLE